jgi:SNF2 family DNA or RNA helicase
MKFDPDEAQKLMHAHLTAHPDSLLFVGMGVGKTAGSLNALSEMILEGDATAALVVAPKLVSVLTWPEEVRNFDEFKWMRVMNLRTEVGKAAFLDGKAHIYMINYESLHVVENLVRARKGTLPYDVVIWDELTRAKNHGSKRINRFRSKVPRPARSWGLTGTPAPNSEMDLFAQVRLIDGGKRLGAGWTAFRDRWFQSTDYQGYTWAAREGAKGQIEAAIADITLTLRTKDWVDIPDPVLNDISVPLSDTLMSDYTTLHRHLFLELKSGGEITAANAAALVTKLLQFTSGVSYDEDRETHEIHDFKMRALRDVVKHADSPVLVAVQYQHEQARLRKHFPQAKFFMDATSQRAQFALKDDWNAGKVPILVGHPASVGHGLNLQHGGHNIVWLTLTYSREQYEQMNCRLIRRGQKHSVNVHRLICPGTVDEVVAAALETKAATEARLLSTLKALEELRDGR